MDNNETVTSAEIAQNIIRGIHQSYYGECTYEAIYIIKTFKLDFNLGSSVKYIKRAGKKTKNREIDLAKAYWYLREELNDPYQCVVDMQPEHISIMFEIGKDWGLSDNLSDAVGNILLSAVSSNPSSQTALRYALKGLAAELETMGITDSPF